MNESGNGHGGKREGAGRPPGSLNPSTLKKKAIRDRLLARYEAEADAMWDAQFAHARGVSYMRLRNPDGSFARATDEKQIDAAIAAGAAWFNIFTESPNTQAFVALSDRAIDKPTEHLEHSGPDGGPIEMGITERLLMARKRAGQS